jgi:hypothetical protein
VQASYEQQVVNANASALTAAVQQYRAAYAKEVSKLNQLEVAWSWDAEFEAGLHDLVRLVENTARP